MSFNYVKIYRYNTKKIVHTHHINQDILKPKHMQLINPNYLERSDVHNNIKAFSDQNMSLLFHYWLIFDRSEKCALFTPILNLDRYNCKEFLDYLVKLTYPEKPEYSLRIAFKFYVDYEIWLPSGFDWKYSDLSF